MQAITFDAPGGPDVLKLGEVYDPRPGAGEIVIEIAASAVNRADLLQREGNYPAPEGASEILGLEAAGTVIEIGPDVTSKKVGDRVTALLAGGGYAGKVAVPADHALPVPKGLSLQQAAALMETACTVYSNVFEVGRLQRGQTLLIHGGAGGIGTAAIQMAKAFGARVIVTAGSAEKCRRCLEIGADHAINYRTEDFPEKVKAATDGKGATVILDVVGAKYISENLSALSIGGRIVVIGLQGGAEGKINLGKLMAKRASIAGTTLRSRPDPEKSALIGSVYENIWPLIEAGKVQPVIDSEFPLAEAASAHRRVEEFGHVGKVVLTVTSKEESS